VFKHFGWNVNYGTEVKQYGTLLEQKGERRYSPFICTSCKRFVHTGCREAQGVTVNHAERQNVNVRLFNRRFTRLTNAFSKKLENHKFSLALHFLHYNFCRIHQTLRVTPAMEAGIANHVWTLEEVANLPF